MRTWASFGLLVKNAISLTEFKVKMLRKQFDLENVNDKIKFLKETAKILNSIDSKIEQEVYIDKLSKEYKISKEALYAEINKLSGNKMGTKVLEKNKKISEVKNKEDIPVATKKREDTLIALLINGDTEVLKMIKEKISPEDIKVETNKQIVDTIFEEYEKTKKLATNVIELFSNNQDALNKVTEIMSQDQEIIDKRAVENIINAYEKDKLTLLKLQIIKRLENEKENEKIMELEKKLNEIIIKLAKIK